MAGRRSLRTGPTLVPRERPGSAGAAPRDGPTAGPEGNFLTRCEKPGMPMIMVWAVYPIAFEDRGTEILLHSQWFDVTRTVHMDVDEGDATPPASPLGHSVGRWEGGALVIDTTAINWPYFDAGGTRQSDAVEVREEFRVSADESRLDYSMTVIDPVTFVEPATVTTHWLALGEQFETYDCLAQ